MRTLKFAAISFGVALGFQLLVYGAYYLLIRSSNGGADWFQDSVIFIYSPFGQIVHDYFEARGHTRWQLLGAMVIYTPLLGLVVYSFIIGIMGLALGWVRSLMDDDGATKPAEPTGTSSSSSDLITSHTPGDSPGGSLRR